MKNEIKTASFRTYLEPHGAGFRLELTRSSQNRSAEATRGFPFLLQGEHDPLCRLVEGRVVTDQGSLVKPVSLAFQRDEYLLTDDPVVPFTNTDVEQCWQQAFSRHGAHLPQGSLLVLGSQLDADGRFIPFESLFYCALKECFFPPVCSVCGGSLQLCVDDDLLARSGLSPYSSSLKRYLFCPRCLDLAGQTEFFAYRVEDGGPPHLKDRWDLIRGLGRLDEEKGRSMGLPCPGCPHHQECYGPDGLAVNRVAPVAFYPFYLLVFDAMTLNGSDFLALISGADPSGLEARLTEQRQMGRLGAVKAVVEKMGGSSPFLFGSDPRLFLEVLYLKLCFLGEMVRLTVPGPDSYGHPRLGFCLDGMWVRLPEKAGLLPLFWDFDARVMDVGGGWSASGESVPSSPAWSLHYLGRAWFYALVANGYQDIRAVFGALREGMEKGQEAEAGSFEACCGDHGQDRFAPQNIFWDPERGDHEEVPEDWRVLWRRALALGWSLLTAGSTGTGAWSVDGFRQQLSLLAGDVRRNMFEPMAVEALSRPVLSEGSGKEVPSETQGSRSDQAIHDLLGRIAERWRGRVAPAKEKTAALEETAVLSAAGAAAEAKTNEMERTVILGKETPAGPPPSPPPSDEDEFHETVILSAANFKKMGPVSPPQGAPMAETVILSPSEGGRGGVPPQAPPKNPQPMARPPADEMPETVMISPSQVRGPLGGSPQEPVPGPDKAAGRPRPAMPGLGVPEGPPREKGRKDTPPEEDALGETVIIRPGKGK